MEDKNRFSILLEHLLEVAEVKNYTLAKRLQYDVSYISKWVSGRMLPAKKTEKRVMEGISACVVDEATDDGRNLLLREYSVSIPSDLKAAIYEVSDLLSYQIFLLSRARTKNLFRIFYFFNI